MGLDVPEHHFYTSALATAAFLKEQSPGCSVFPIGEAGLTHALYEAGCTMNDVNPDYVVVGEGKTYTLDTLTKATNLVLAGAKLIGANSDISGPIEHGIAPACGALVSPIEMATGVKAYFCGKPNPLMMRTGLRILNCHSAEAVMIGDRMDTDVISGLESGMSTVLVLSGVSTRETIKHLHTALQSSWMVSATSCEWQLSNTLIFYGDFAEMNNHYLFSAPGRTEICGNHTDHQHGCVLAAAINLETVADVMLTKTNYVTILSDGYPDLCIDLNDLNVYPKEINTTASLVRGILAAFRNKGAALTGFIATIHSSVLPGSGLSSSAAFEVLIGTICNTLFFDNRLTPIEIAQIGQWAENVYFGKPCGLMDQMASAVGGLVFIDFMDSQNPIVKKIDYDFSKTGHVLCIIDSGADHANLTDEYASITYELKSLCTLLGKEALRQIPEAEFLEKLPYLRGKVSDRALLRAFHIYRENERVLALVKALQSDDFDAFLRICKESGHSSWMYMQNIYPAGAISQQAVGFALALCDTLLQGRGAYRIHGGGFAGTIQAFVPTDMLDTFKTEMERNLGNGSCHILNIRPQGGIQLQ